MALRDDEHGTFALRARFLVWAGPGPGKTGHARQQPRPPAVLTASAYGFTSARSLLLRRGRSDTGFPGMMALRMPTAQGAGMSDRFEELLRACTVAVEVEWWRATGFFVARGTILTDLTYGHGSKRSKVMVRPRQDAGRLELTESPRRVRRLDLLGECPVWDEQRRTTPVSCGTAL
jgi:hypothetical protein